MKLPKQLVSQYQLTVSWCIFWACVLVITFISKVVGGAS